MGNIEAISGVGRGQAQAGIKKNLTKKRLETFMANWQGGGYINNGYGPNNPGGSVMIMASPKTVSASQHD